MLKMSDYFIVRNKFIRHVRNRLAKIPLESKLSHFREHAPALLNSFELTNRLSRNGCHILIDDAVSEIKKSVKRVEKMIAHCHSELEYASSLSTRSKDRKKLEKDNNDRIVYLKTKYAPFFDETFTRVFTKSTLNMTDKTFDFFKMKIQVDDSVTITEYNGEYFVNIPKEKEKFQAKNDLFYDQI